MFPALYTSHHNVMTTCSLETFCYSDVGPLQLDPWKLCLGKLRNVLLDWRIEPATIWIPSRHASDWATKPDLLNNRTVDKYCRAIVNVTRTLVAPVAEWLRSLIISALNSSSSHCYGFEPSSGHMGDKPSSTYGWSGGFSGGSPIFAPPTNWLGLKWVKYNLVRS